MQTPHDTTISPSLQDSLKRLESKRQGALIFSVDVSGEKLANLGDLTNLNLTSSAHGSNNTLETLETLNSSIEMLTPTDAAKLFPDECTSYEAIESRKEETNIGKVDLNSNQLKWTPMDSINLIHSRWHLLLPRSLLRHLLS